MWLRMYLVRVKYAPRKTYVVLVAYQRIRCKFGKLLMEKEFVIRVKIDVSRLV